MRRIRSHVESELAPGTTIILPDGARNHLTRVLRLRDGDEVLLFNGDGHDYHARLALAGRSASADVLARQPAAAAEAGLAIILVQALARGEKMDWIVQKATEIGVARIVPVSSQRSEVRLDGERASKRIEHWRRVAISACEQCGRARVPDIDAPQPLHAAIATIDAPLRLTLDPDGKAGVADVAATHDRIALAIGPEGGFDEHELRLFAGTGWCSLRLGARVLRTETAGLVAVAALFAHAGEL